MMFVIEHNEALFHKSANRRLAYSLLALGCMFCSFLAQATPFSYKVGISSETELLPNQTTTISGVIINTGSSPLDGVPVGTGFLMSGFAVIDTNNPGPDDIVYTVGPYGGVIHTLFTQPVINPGESFHFTWSIITTPNRTMDPYWGDPYGGYLLMVPADGSTLWMSNPPGLSIHSMGQFTDVVTPAADPYTYVEYRSDDLSAYLQVTPIPAPPTWLLMLSSLPLLYRFRRSRSGTPGNTQISGC